METLSLPRAPPTHTHIHLQGLPWGERGDRAPQGRAARRGNKQLPNGGPGCGPLFLGPGGGQSAKPQAAPFCRKWGVPEGPGQTRGAAKAGFKQGTRQPVWRGDQGYGSPRTAFLPVQVHTLSPLLDPEDRHVSFTVQSGRRLGRVLRSHPLLQGNPAGTSNIGPPSRPGSKGEPKQGSEARGRGVSGGSGPPSRLWRGPLGDPALSSAADTTGGSQEVKINAWRGGRAAPPRRSLYLMRPLLPEGYTGFGRLRDGPRLGWARPRGRRPGSLGMPTPTSPKRLQVPRTLAGLRRCVADTPMARPEPALHCWLTCSRELAGAKLPWAPAPGLTCAKGRAAQDSGCGRGNAASSRRASTLTLARDLGWLLQRARVPRVCLSSQPGCPAGPGDLCSGHTGGETK